MLSFSEDDGLLLFSNDSEIISYLVRVGGGCSLQTECLRFSPNLLPTDFLPLFFRLMRDLDVVVPSCDKCGIKGLITLSCLLRLSRLCLGCGALALIALLGDCGLAQKTLCVRGGAVAAFLVNCGRCLELVTSLSLRGDCFLLDLCLMFAMVGAVAREVESESLLNARGLRSSVASISVARSRTCPDAGNASRGS